MNKPIFYENLKETSKKAADIMKVTSENSSKEVQ